MIVVVTVVIVVTVFIFHFVLILISHSEICIYLYGLFTAVMRLLFFCGVHASYSGTYHTPCRPFLWICIIWRVKITLLTSYSCIQGVERGQTLGGTDQRRMRNKDRAHSVEPLLGNSSHNFNDSLWNNSIVLLILIVWY